MFQIAFQPLSYIVSDRCLFDGYLSALDYVNSLLELLVAGDLEEGRNLPCCGNCRDAVCDEVRLGIYYVKADSVRHCELKVVKCALLSPADAER